MLKRANRLSSDFFFFLLSIMVAQQWLSYYNDQNPNKQYKSLGIALTTYRYRRTRTTRYSSVILKHSSVNAQCYTPFCVRITLFIGSTPPGHVFIAYCDKMNEDSNSQVIRNIERGCLHAFMRSILACIARAAVNESVCEDSTHIAHVVCICSSFYFH